ncbi:MAG: ketopantoate reductase family protein [Candidatus Thorarchaeota archaeon]
MLSSKLRIGIIGAGSIGSLFGGYLAGLDSEDYSLDIIFFGTKQHINEINKYGLKIHHENVTISINNVNAYESPDVIEKIIENDSTWNFDFLFLSTKTYDLEASLKQYQKLIQASKYIVILQNGIGNEDLVEQCVSKERIIRIITSHGALLKEPGHVYHTGQGFTKVGFAFLNSNIKQDIDINSPSKDLEILKELLDLSGIKTEIVEDIIQASWEKVFVNIGINALGALTRLHNGALLEDESLKTLMKEAIIEAVKVAKLNNIHLSEENYVELAYSVAKNTYYNKNSMLQDVLNGRKTEIDFFNGKIVNLAKEVGIRVQVNEMLTYLIKGLERSFS